MPFLARPAELQSKIDQTNCIRVTAKIEALALIYWFFAPSRMGVYDLKPYADFDIDLPVVGVGLWH